MKHLLSGRNPREPKAWQFLCAVVISAIFLFLAVWGYNRLEESRLERLAEERRVKIASELRRLKTQQALEEKQDAQRRAAAERRQRRLLEPPTPASREQPIERLHPDRSNSKQEDTIEPPTQQAATATSQQKLRITGQTTTTETLRLDVLRIMVPHAQLALQCQRLDSVDFRVLRPPKNTSVNSQGVIIGGEPIIEQWTLGGCGSLHDYRIVFTPDGKGGSSFVFTD